MQGWKRVLRWAFYVEACVLVLGGSRVALSCLDHLRHPVHGADPLERIAVYIQLTLTSYGIGVGIMAALAAAFLHQDSRWGRALAWTASVLNLAILPLGTILGVSGLIILRRASQQPSTAPILRAHQPVPGDGTGKWSGFIHGGVQWLAVWFGYHLVSNWAAENSLRRTDSGIVSLVLIGAAVLLCVAVHEFGHFAAGWAGEFRLVGWRVGPFDWTYREGRWRFQFVRAGLIGGGYTAMVPTRPDGIIDRARFHVAGGPIASALLALSSGAMLLAAPGSAWALAWNFLAMVTVIAGGDAVGNLVPAGTETGYSDGARLWQLIRRGPWADFLCARYSMALSRSTALLPREWPTEMVERAADFPAKPGEATGMTALAYVHFEDRGEIHRAEPYLRRLMSQWEDERQQALVRHLLPEFAYFEAMYGKGAEAGRRWLELAEDDGSSDYYRARAAVLAAEGDMASAREIWEDGWSIVSRLGPEGVYAIDRRQYRSIAERWFAPASLAMLTEQIHSESGPVIQPEPAAS